MSSAAATADASAAKKGGGKKKLIMMVAIALIVLAVAGAAAVVMMKKKAAAADDADGDSPAAESTVEKHDPKHPPAFVPLDPFTVNLADRDADRYAQVGITLEVEDAHTAEEIKTYMPAIRNNILMVLAQKSAADLRDASGKARLAFEIKRESSRALGVEIDDEMPPEAAASSAAGSDEAPAPKPKKKKKKHVATEPSPIRAVQFSNFIIQ